MGLPYRFHAPAKVNLYLHVTGRRADGYHLLDSLAVFTKDVHDDLEISIASEDRLVIDGAFAQALGAQSGQNLITRAVDCYRGLSATGARFQINLRKNLPLGAGIGGGSSDAARTFQALEHMTGLKIDEAARDEALLRLGADVPVCYRQTPCRFQGIGGEITSAPPLPPFHLLLIWPGVHCVTGEIFKARPVAYHKSEISLPPSFETLQSLTEFLAHTRNDLEGTAISFHPEIGAAKEFLARQDGCLLARMSGSGASVFGIFEHREDTERACMKARSSAGWWSAVSAV